MENNNEKENMGEVVKREAKMRQPNPAAIKTLIRTNYAHADVWLRGVQVVRGGVWLGAEGEALLRAKIEAHKIWLKKHKKTIEEILI